MKADTTKTSEDSITYYDPKEGVVLMISGRRGTFRNVKNYIDCSRADLEKDLQKLQGDSTLKLIDCRRSPHYPKETTILHFETSAYAPHLERCLIYLLHNHSDEIQFFFLYDKTRQNRSIEYIDHIMQSLRLRHTFPLL
jgi:hypothetical protein